MKIEVDILMKRTTFRHPFPGPAFLDLGSGNRFVIDFFYPRVGKNPAFEDRRKIPDWCDVMEFRKIVVSHFLNLHN
jgi:hypothetical protein